MCTLILAWRVFDDAPIAAAANRDEALGRPSRPPGVSDEDPRVVAPRDEEAGGTWIGYNDAGLFVAVTNRRTDIDGERSRGLLVRDALARESASAASSFVRDELADRQYAGFNLVVADREEAALLEWDGVLRTTHFDPGVHVVVNEGYNGAASKAEAIREAVHPDLPTDDATGAIAPDATSETDSAEWFERAKEVLRDHDLGACVHADGYGTRSSSLVAIDAEGAGRYWFADGTPCETDYEEVAVEGGDG
ncbi:NRDE family protein [Halorussus gelatinilyticus]|uniref:NRDE family protein n=1 Tax=Halorussus gelatinilyticus TaxID=2937524 RepID=A0A8U0IFJ5_9EURY|nr:NRDE family protein [Halorussus gelatinilyticus]UPV99849.1 NRDE family protein [Halorussus gelatinilyticus]